MANKKRRTGTAEGQKTIGLPASTETNEEMKSKQKEPVSTNPAGPRTNLGLTLDATPVVKCWIIDLKGLDLNGATAEIIKQVCHENLQLPRDQFKKRGQESASTTQTRQKRRQNSETGAGPNLVWQSYLPPVQGSPTFVRISNNRMQLTRRSLPYIVVAIKRKLVPAIIDPSVSLSFICNDVYNIYVQSRYSEEEIRYSEGGRKKEVAYCWWSQRRALITRARITLPITWSTIDGGVEDAVQLNLIQPNPGLINGFIVLGKDFYTKCAPSFCLSKNLVAINLLSQRDLTIEMKMYWYSVVDFIPIADRRKGVVYFIDKYEKNHFSRPVKNLDKYRDRRN